MEVMPLSASWYEVSCTVPASAAEEAADYLAEASGCGVCTDNRAVDTFNSDDIPELSMVAITGYFSLPCNIEAVMLRLNSFLSSLPLQIDQPPMPAPTFKIIGEEDWASSWKAHFKQLAIGKRLLISPSWEQIATDEQRHVITLDPGMAFGTGGHETTSLCLATLEDILDGTITNPAGSAENTHLLDLGTGSGILAIAAAKLGVVDIDAVDIDPQAVIVAEENCRLNQVSSQIRCSTTPLEKLPGGYHMIVANILAEELVRMAPELVKRLVPDGLLILSGILGEREAFVVDGFLNFPVRLERSSSAGEWRCLLYRRKP
jgi:ribosomal protein L11 methyltransferase